MFNIFLNGFNLFIISPILEWLVHYILHKINNHIHKIHHLEFHKNEKNINIEIWPIFFIIICIYYKYYIYALPFLRYHIIHTLIHKNKGFFKSYANHHRIHHMYPNCNYAVTSIWPDKLFRTEYKI